MFLKHSAIPEKYIILNFSHGNGPVLRTLELAIAINHERQKRGLDRFGIIIPWVYRNRQTTIFKENFGTIAREYPHEFVFDNNFEDLLVPIFYERKPYGQWLEDYLKQRNATEDAVKKYIHSGIQGVTYRGKAVKISPKQIAFTISRYPVVDYGIRPAYYVSFGLISEIYEKASKEPDVMIDNTLLEKGVVVHKSIEQNHDLHFIADPGTFSYLDNRKKMYPTEITTPPNSNQKLRHPPFFVRKGAYVAITGTPGMQHLFDSLHAGGLTLYTHKTGCVKNSRKASPKIIQHKKILFQIGRIGWGAIWLSMKTKKPFLALPYHKNDDPEVYFNNKCVEKLGLAKIYHGQPVQELLDWRPEYLQNVEKIERNLRARYGTLDGVSYTAKRIVNHYK